MAEIKKLKTITIRKDATIEFIYDDDLKCFIDTNTGTKIFRASHVEPDENGKWFADLGPVKGPKLTGFNTRAEALNAEVKWLQQNYLRQGIKDENSNSGSEAEQGSV